MRFDKIAPALIAAAFHQPDWRWVQEQCLELTGHADANLRHVAVVAPGHLARIHRALDIDRVLPVLERLSAEAALAGRRGGYRAPAFRLTNRTQPKDSGT